MANRLREIRERRGMSQAEVGRLSGLDQQRISTLEREGPPRLDVARRLADALETTVEKIYPTTSAGHEAEPGKAKR